jgi:hypothetical protein
MERRSVIKRRLKELCALFFVMGLRGNYWTSKTGRKGRIRILERRLVVRGSERIEKLADGSPPVRIVQAIHLKEKRRGWMKVKARLGF